MPEEQAISALQEEAAAPAAAFHFWKLTVAYDGTDFCGYQFQPGARTVQGELTAALRRMLREEDLVVTGASRTDSGVHALGQTVNFKTARELAPEALLRGLNGYLPEDLAVTAVQEVEESFHSTFDARGKHYRYTIYRGLFDDPFTRRFHLFWRRPLDLEAMRQVLPHLVGEREFKGLQVKSGKPEEATRRLVTAAELSEEGPLVHLDFWGKGFMYKQVRSLAGLVLAAGDGRIRPEEAESLCDGSAKIRKSEVAPPQGLTLVKVYYDQGDFDARN